MNLPKPECTVGRESGSPESISTCKLPHPREKLSETATPNGHTNDDVRLERGSKRSTGKRSEVKMSAIIQLQEKRWTRRWSGVS